MAITKLGNPNLIGHKLACMSILTRAYQKANPKLAVMFITFMAFVKTPFLRFKETQYYLESFICIRCIWNGNMVD
jgi:hypothetical protein